jgi:hypothetical protein
MPDPYRLLVTGSRDWKDQDAIVGAIREVRREIGGRPITVIHGDCPTGADAIAAYLVSRASPSFGLGQEKHPAQNHPTEDFGAWPACGPRRNAHMVSLGADLCVAFIGPCTKPNCRRPQPHGSHGATNCADLAEQAGIPVRRITP